MNRLRMMNHSRSLRAIFSLIRARKNDATFGMTSSWFTLIENTSVTVVLAGTERPVLVAVNDCHHLYDPVVGA